MTFRKLFNGLETPRDACAIIEQEMKCFSAPTGKVWFELGALISQAKPQLFEHYKRNYREQLNTHCSSLFESRWLEDHILHCQPEQSLITQFSEQAKARRKEYLSKARNTGLRLVVASFHMESETHSLFFEDRCFVSQQKLQNDNKQLERISADGVHIVIMSHGVKGKSQELAKMALYLSMISDNRLSILNCRTLNNDSASSIHLLGHRLAEEIKDHVVSVSSKAKVAGISFLGYSLGRPGLSRRSGSPGCSELPRGVQGPHEGLCVDLHTSCRHCFWAFGHILLHAIREPQAA